MFQSSPLLESITFRALRPWKAFYGRKKKFRINKTETFLNSHQAQAAPKILSGNEKLRAEIRLRYFTSECMHINSWMEKAASGWDRNGVVKSILRGCWPSGVDRYWNMIVGIFLPSTSISLKTSSFGHRLFNNLRNKNINHQKSFLPCHVAIETSYDFRFIALQ